MNKKQGTVQLAADHFGGSGSLGRWRHCVRCRNGDFIATMRANYFMFS